LWVKTNISAENTACIFNTEDGRCKLLRKFGNHLIIVQCVTD